MEGICCSPLLVELEKGMLASLYYWLADSLHGQLHPSLSCTNVGLFYCLKVLVHLLIITALVIIQWRRQEIFIGGADWGLG